MDTTRQNVSPTLFKIDMAEAISKCLGNYSDTIRRKFSSYSKIPKSTRTQSCYSTCQQCGGEGTCRGGAACLTHHLWQDLNQVIFEFLSGITLADLVARAQANAERRVQTVPAVIRRAVH